MIAFWNKKEVYVGTSMKDFNDARRMLIDNGIDYRHRLVNDLANSRQGAYGTRQDLSVMYYVYVHKNDYERAEALLRGVKL